MKANAVILIIFFLSSEQTFGKKNAVEINQTYYGVSFSFINSGSGQSAGYTANGSITKGRTTLEAGLIYCENDIRISGGDFKYRILLGNLYRIQGNDKIFTPYFQYNLNYQNGISYSPDLVQLGSETYTVPSDPGTVSTIGHYLAYGNKIRLFNRAYFDTSFGLGVYQGSLDKVNGPETWGIHKENYGFTFAFKVGFGYTFN